MLILVAFLLCIIIWMGVVYYENTTYEGQGILQIILIASVLGLIYIVIYMLWYHTTEPLHYYNFPIKL